MLTHTQSYSEVNFLQIIINFDAVVQQILIYHQQYSDQNYLKSYPNNETSLKCSNQLTLLNRIWLHLLEQGICK